MKYLLAVLFFSLASAHAWAVSNDAFANATVINVSPTSGGIPINAGLIAANGVYRIESVGTTNFTAIGADSNLVGVVFQATGAASGTGTASSVSTFSGSNSGATSEIGEPVHATVGAGQSVWWAWTPTIAGTATIDTAGSSFDTVLAVYTGSNVAALTQVAYDDDVSSSSQTSKVAFTVRAGNTYYIAVDGYAGGAKAPTGSITLHVSLGAGTYGAQNDNYVKRAVIAGEYAIARGDSSNASIEPGESQVTYYSSDVNSVWWTWTAPRSGAVTITADMILNPGLWLNFWGDMEVFTGAPATLSGLASASLGVDEGALATTTSSPSLTRSVVAGQVLQIRISDYPAEAGAQITLTVAMATSGNAINDRFPKRIAINSSNVSGLTGTNAGATADASEPAHYAEVTAGAFVINQKYIINSFGTTDFAAVGASTPLTLGEEFQATGVGTGTGTAIHLRPQNVHVQPIVTYTAGSFVVGQQYVIKSVGTTDFTAIGADSNNSSVVFTATGAGTGTGTATLYDNGLLVVGKTYRIESVGTTDFVGLSSGTIVGTPVPGETFTANATGNGTGTVLPVEIVAAGAFVIGRNYRIETTGTTDFTSIGAASNAVGTDFQATGIGSGTGSASTLTASKSVWWTWVAPANGYATMDTSGSAIDTLLNIYTSLNLGNITLSNLISVASNDDVANGTDNTSSARFAVVRGTAYQIAVDSGDDTRSAGALSLSITFTSDAPAITGQVQNRTVNLPANSTTFTVLNTGQTAVYDWQRKAAGSNTWVHVVPDNLTIVATTTVASIPNGVATSTLSLNAIITAAMNGDQFRCVITNVGGQVTSQSATLTVVSWTTYTGASQSADISGPFTVLPGDSIAFYAKGLPAGMVLHQNSGAIDGRLTAKPGTYTITYWAITTNPVTKKKTTTATHTLVLTVLAFPSAITGSFEGLLLDGSALPAGKIELLVATTGAFTGKLTYLGKVLSFKNVLTLEAVVPPAVPTTASLTSFAVAPGLTLTITVRSDSTMKATVTGGAGGPVTTDMGAQNGVKLKTYITTVPAPWANTYNLAFADPTYAVAGSGPEGSGYAFVTVSPTGLLTLKGKLADGTAVTASLSPDTGTNGTYRPYLQLYANKLGYLSGLLSMGPRGGNTGLYHVVPSVGLGFYWSKVLMGNDKGSYPAGFTTTGITLVMEPWIAPTNSYLLGSLGLVTLMDSQTVGNFDLNLDQFGGVSNLGLNPDKLPLSLKMSALGRISVLSAPPSPAPWTIVITLRTGYFQGNFTLLDKRKVTFEGILMQLPSGTALNQFGRGYFLVPPPKIPAGGRISAGDVNFTGLIAIP